ncbi:MAG: 4-carboxymuconolactone decarboxylase [Gammaproteobacteria bacterium]|jgi:4-carboxymuconolactone decarboxylase
MVLNNKTYLKGKKLRRKVIGKNTIDPIWDELDDVTRPLQEYVTEFAWGEIFTRRGLDQKTRILLNLVMLVVQGEYRVLSLHIRAALNLGCSRIQIREALIQTSTFAGFARSTHACKLAQEIFDEIDNDKSV